MADINDVLQVARVFKSQAEADLMKDTYSKVLPTNMISFCDAVIELLKEQEDDKPKGHWVPYEPDKRGYTDGFTCSRCERVILSDHYCKMIDFDFCPYCGAFMDNAEGR